jgi:hypothetical protein
MRLLDQLEFAERTTARKLPRVTGTMQKRGLAFQRKVARQLDRIGREIHAEVEHEPWFNFIDHNGMGSAVPDGLFHYGRVTVVIEVKLSWVADARRKLLGLYLPLIMVTHPQQTVRGVIICKNLRPECDGEIILHLERALTNASVPVLQWLGVGHMPWMARNACQP